MYFKDVGNLANPHGVTIIHQSGVLNGPRIDYKLVDLGEYHGYERVLVWVSAIDQASLKSSRSFQAHPRSSLKQSPNSPFPSMGQVFERSEMSPYVPTVSCEEDTSVSEIKAESKLAETGAVETKSLLPSGEESKLEANLEDTVEVPTILADTSLPL